MASYVIARVNVTDMEQYKEYMKLTPDAIAKYGGKFIARGHNTVTLEGPEETDRVVVVEFPSFEQAQAFYHSPEYGEAKLKREGAATAQFIAVQGVDEVQ
ncbi:MAG: DUF1330 domain-containing protein [Chloroflexota bacterium]